MNDLVDLSVSLGKQGWTLHREVSGPGDGGAVFCFTKGGDTIIVRVQFG